MSFAHKGFGFLEDITVQVIGGCEVHLGDFWKECTRCHEVQPLIDGFGQLRCMDSAREPLQYRSQAQCKKCRGEGR